jgi:hypothetical protein
MDAAFSVQNFGKGGHVMPAIFESADLGKPSAPPQNEQALD